jgi:uncharacterized membrane protein YhaH (DUF805 family)
MRSPYHRIRYELLAFAVIREGRLAMIGFLPAIKLAYSRYFDFGGRSTRAEYWWYQLYSYIVSIVMTLSFLIGAIAGIGALFGDDDMAIAAIIGLLLFLICFLIILLSIIPAIAITIRRLHDSGKSSLLVWLLFVPLVNIVAGVLVFIFSLLPSSAGDNKYGPPSPAAK